MPEGSLEAREKGRVSGHHTRASGHQNFDADVPHIKELNAKYVIDIFEKWRKPTVGLPYEIIADQDILFILAIFLDWAYSVGVFYKASSVYHLETDAESKIIKKTIIPIFTTKKLEDSTNWLREVPSVEIEVNTVVSGPRGKYPLHILLGFDPKLGST